MQSSISSDLVELGGAAAPRARRRSAPRRAARRRRASSSARRADQPGAVGPWRTRAISSALSPARRPSRSWWPHSYSQPVLWATRRITSSVSSRGSLPPGISAPANQSQRRKSPRWRASVVKMCGGRPPRREPITRTIAALTEPDAARRPPVRSAVHPERCHFGPDRTRDQSARRMPVRLWPCPPRCSSSTRPRCSSAPSTRCRRRSSGADGKPVNALLGTANLILREVELHEPRAVVLCFGPDAASYRTELYPAYHAERDGRCPTSSRHQFAAAARLLRGLRLDGRDQRRPRGRRPARHLARREAEAGGRALIMTGDRDMYQCAASGSPSSTCGPATKGPKKSTPTACASVVSRRTPEHLALGLALGDRRVGDLA